MEKGIERSIEEKIQRIKAYWDGVLSPEEEAEFSRWIDSSPKNKALFDRVQDERVWLEKIHFRERNDLERGWHGIQKKMQKRPMLFVRLMRYAAMLVVVMLTGLIAFSVWDDGKGDDLKLGVQNETLSAKGGYKAYLELTNGKRLELDSLSKLETHVEGAVIKAEDQGTVIVHEQQGDSLVESVEYNRMIIPRGGEYKIVLADGSQVWINSQSVLEFPSRFTGGERRVKLKGEAYFEVSRNESKPFVVEVEDKEVRVLGTQFNTSDYKGSFVTTLVSGKVQVRVGDADYILHPSMQARVESGKVVVEKVDIKEFTAWKDGLFVFKKKRLQDVLDILSRWYDVDVFYQNLDLQDLHFTGTIQRHSNIADVLKFLEKTDMVKFTLKGRTLIVSK